MKNLIIALALSFSFSSVAFSHCGSCDAKDKKECNHKYEQKEDGKTAKEDRKKCNCDGKKKKKSA